MLSHTQKAGTVQSFGFVLTEIVMITSLLYCLETLQFTKLFLPLIPLTIAPVLSVLALFSSNGWYSSAVVFDIATASGLLIYCIILAVTYPSYADEIRLENESFGFWLLLAGMLLAMVFLLWTVQYLIALSNVAPAERLALTSKKVSYTRIHIYVLTIVAYSTVLLASTLLLFASSLEWTSFYIELFLAYGVPFLMTMMLFKSDTSLGVGAVMLITVSLIDFVYAVWILLWYGHHYIETDTVFSARLSVWALVVATFLRAALSSLYAVLCITYLPSTFEERFGSELKHS